MSFEGSSMGSRDLSKWLDGKFGSSTTSMAENWSTRSLSTLLSQDVLANIPDCFVDLQSTTKIRLLLSLIHLPKRSLDQWKRECDEIINLAALDTDDWVQTTAQLLKSFPTTNGFNFSFIHPHGVDDTDTATSSASADNFSARTFDELRRLVGAVEAKDESAGVQLIPLDGVYLNKTAYAATYGSASQFAKHFALKRKSKAAAQRTEFLQKAADPHSKTALSAGSVPAMRSRVTSKQINTESAFAPKPIQTPNALKLSAGFSKTFSSRPMPSLLTNKRDKGIKLLDIDETPQAKMSAERQKKKAIKAEAAQRGEERATAKAAAALVQKQQKTAGLISFVKSEEPSTSGASTVVDEVETKPPPSVAPAPTQETGAAVRSFYKNTELIVQRSADETVDAVIAAVMKSGSVDDVEREEERVASPEPPAKKARPTPKQRKTVAPAPSTTVPAATGIQAVQQTPPTRTPNVLLHDYAGSQPAVSVIVGAPAGGHTAYSPATPAYAVVCTAASVVQQQRVVFATPSMTPGGSVQMILSSAPPGMLPQTYQARPVQTGLGYYQLPQQQQAGTFLATAGTFVGVNAGVGQQAPTFALQSTSAGTSVPLRVAVPLGQYPQQQQQQPQQPQQAAGTTGAPPKGALTISREVMQQAQEIFRTANKLTRPEKALILGFMAGSREHPCPNVGSVVTVKLSETVESRQTQSGGTFELVVVEEFFQMNYTSGEWRKLSSTRPYDGAQLNQQQQMQAAGVSSSVASTAVVGRSL